MYTLVAAKTSSSEAGETGRALVAEFCLSVSLLYLKGSLTYHKTLQHGGRRLQFLSKGSRTTDFIALENPLPSAGFEPANLGSNGKHDNHCATENDLGW
jgi:hypothetical protein